MRSISAGSSPLCCKAGAATRLLDSYDAERRPSRRPQCRAWRPDSIQNNEAFGRGDTAGSKTTGRARRCGTRKLGRDAGARCRPRVPHHRRCSSAIATRARRSACRTARRRRPTSRRTMCRPARPGSRAPHVWLDARAARSSTSSAAALCCCGLPGAADARLSRQAARARGVPLDVRRSPSLRKPPTSISGSLVLVRPDGHVAWRGDAVPADAARADRPGARRVARASA